MVPEVALTRGGNAQSQGLPGGITPGRNAFISINLKYTMTWARYRSCNSLVCWCIMLFMLVSIPLCG